MIRAILLLLVVLPRLLSAGLAQYSSLVVADPPGLPARENAVRVTYLGTNGYQFETSGHALLVDPYFSRINLFRVALGWSVQPDSARIREGLSHVRPGVDGILVTHGHFDHLLDAPVIVRATDSRLIASSAAVKLAIRAGAPPSKCQTVTAGDSLEIGPWHITVFPASHDHVLLIGVPFNGPADGVGAPRTARDWVCGDPLSYLIEVGGFRIFADSGGTQAVLPPANIRPVDLAILGVALPDSRARFAEVVKRLRPRYVLPSHQDDFFQPLESGFRFGKLTDFSFVREKHQELHLPGKLILLDYFRPWTLTKN